MRSGPFVPCYVDAIEQTAEAKCVRSRIFELVEFLHDIQAAIGSVPRCIHGVLT